MTHSQLNFVLGDFAEARANRRAGYLKQAFQLEQVRVKQADRLENLLLALTITLLLLAVLGMRGKKLGYADKFSAPKKRQTVLSWIWLTLHLLRQSSKYLNWQFDNKAGCFSF